MLWIRNVAVRTCDTTLINLITRQAPRNFQKTIFIYCLNYFRVILCQAAVVFDDKGTNQMEPRIKYVTIVSVLSRGLLLLAALMWNMIYTRKVLCLGLWPIPLIEKKGYLLSTPHQIVMHTSLFMEIPNLPFLNSLVSSID